MDRLLQFILSNAMAAMALALIAAGIARHLRRPPLTRALWILVLLKLVTPPIWSVPISFPSEPAPARVNPAPFAQSIADLVPAPTPDEALPIDGEAAITDIPQPDVPIPPAQPQVATLPPLTIPWVPILSTIWGIGALTCIGLILRSTLRIRRLINQSVPAPLGIRRRANHLARVMGLKKCPQILFVRGSVPPMLCAAGLRARIILPASLWSRLDDSQQDTVLVHELAHLRHGDHWVRRLELFVAVLYWWHPAVWWSRCQLRESSEQCCDAWVVWTLPRLARSYASALIETVDFISLSRPSLPVLASGMGQFTDLRRRLVMINQGSARRALSARGYAAVCSLAGLLLPLAPSFGQEAPPAPPAPPETPAFKFAPQDPFKPTPPVPPTPKANISTSTDSFTYSVDEDEQASPKPRPAPQNRAELDKARAQVDKLRAQLRDAERHLNDLQRNAGRSSPDTGRDEGQKEREKAQAEAQKEREKARAEAQKERAKAMAEAQKARALAALDRQRAAQDRQRAMQDQKRAHDEVQNPNENIDGPKPRINVQTRIAPPRTDEYVRAGARLRAAGSSANQNDRDTLERRLDQMEKQLDEMVGQLRQMKQQVSKPTPSR